MDFDILGPLRVTSERGELDLGAPAQRALLAVLLTSPNVAVLDDRLVDELWGETPPPSAHHLLQVYVSRLRALFEERKDGPRILRHDSGYALRVEPQELDAERFLGIVAEGRELRERDPQAADEILSDAIRLWRGPPFADFADAPLAVREEARYLERQHLEALEAWFDVRLQLGRHHELVPELAQLMAQHPYDETLHTQLALALFRCGRQAEALEVARTLQTRLREDLGVDASREIRDLYRDILLQAPRLALTPPEPPNNLPTRLTSFVGRRRELQEVTELVETSRLLTLTGPGGIGKTRLALEVARRQLTQFPAGIWWIDLGPVQEPDRVLDETARVLGVSASPAVGLAEALVRALRRRRALLVLDNCEQVATAVGDLVDRILAATSGPRVLATSRTPLGVEHERRWMVPPLELPPEAATLAQLRDSDAVQLLLARGYAADPEFELDAENGRAVAELCARLDGLSLAIEMAAARLSTSTPQEIVRQLNQRFALLELSTADGGTRHRTLGAAVDTSYMALSESERATFDRLSVFVGTFDLDAAAAVGTADGNRSSDPLAGVTSLLHASLLTPEEDERETRYRLLEPLRDYAAAHLRTHGAEDDTRRAHAAYHLDLAVRAGAAVGTPDFAAWMKRLAQSYAELRQALTWSLEHDDRAKMLRAARALQEFWYRRGDAREARHWAALMLEGNHERTPRQLLADVHFAASFGANLATDLTAAALHAEKATRLWRDAGDTLGVIFGLWGRANVAFALGDLDSSRRYATEALAACDRTTNRWARARPLSALAYTSLFGGSPTQARAQLAEALPLYHELGDVGSLVILALIPLSEAARLEHDLEASERFAAEAVQAATGRAWEAAALVQYGMVLSDLGEFDTAETTTRRGLRVALEAGLGLWFRIALRELARSSARHGRWEEATILLAASRQEVPAPTPDPAIYAPLEERCRSELGDERFRQLASQGDSMSHDQLMGLLEPEEPQTLSTSY